MINQNWNQNQGNQGWGMNRPMRTPTADPSAQNRASRQISGPGGVNPALRQSSQMGGPSNQYMSQQDYFRGIAPWGGNQSQLFMQNPMMGMSGQWGQNRGVGMQPFVQPMQGYGQQRGFPANQPTSNPYMPQMQQPQPQPQQMPANPYNPYQSSQGWNQSGQFPGFRFPAY